MSTTTITTATLAARLGKSEVARTLANGKEVRQLVWEGGDLARMDAEILRPLSAQPPEGRYVLDGPVPAWFAVGFCHGVHPQLAALHDPRLGVVDVRAPRPSGAGEGRNLAFKTISTDEFTLVEFEVVGGVFDLADLDGVRPPEVETTKGVVLSGRGPNWLAVTLAMGYHAASRWVACWQPGSGATVCMTHHPSKQLGSVIADDVVAAVRGQ